MQVSLASPLYMNTAFLPTSAQAMTFFHSRSWKPALADVVLDLVGRVLALDVRHLLEDEQVLFRVDLRQLHEDDVAWIRGRTAEGVRGFDVGAGRGDEARTGRAAKQDESHHVPVGCAVGGRWVAGPIGPIVPRPGQVGVHPSLRIRGE